MNDTICTEEQPCKTSNCPYCDPFADKAPALVNHAERAIVPPVNSPGLQAFTAPPPVSPLPSSDWYAQSPVSPIPSLGAAYQEMRTRYAAYEDAVCKLALAENTVTGDKIALEQARTVVLLKYTDPKELGSNEAQRTAAVNFHCDLHIKKLQAGQRSVELLKCETEVARIRCRMADNTLRFCEALIMQQEDYTE